MNEQDKLLTFKEVAEYLKIHRAYVGKFLRMHNIPIKKLSAKWARVRLSDLEKIINGGENDETIKQ